jgi:protein-S-isoprenylcysteine O-methyltransferase Ste14
VTPLPGSPPAHDGGASPEPARPTPLAAMLLTVRALVVVVLFVALWAWLASVVRAWDGRLGVAIPAPARTAGFPLCAAGALLTVACIVAFAARGRGTPAPFDPPRAFVAVGPYRYVRNPMYLGAAAVIAGVGLFLRSPSIVLLAAAFLLVFHLFVLLYEEPALRARFDETYVAYTRTVHRWLPTLPVRAWIFLLLALLAGYLLAAQLTSGPPSFLDDTF